MKKEKKKNETKDKLIERVKKEIKEWETVKKRRGYPLACTQQEKYKKEQEKQDKVEKRDGENKDW